MLEYVYIHEQFLRISFFKQPWLSCTGMWTHIIAVSGVGDKGTDGLRVKPARQSQEPGF